MKFFLSLIVFTSFTISINAQNFANKDFYLIDSLVIEDLNEYDKTLLDSSLNIFHNTTDDTIKLEGLYNFVEASWDLNLWPVYNEVIYKYSNNALKSETNKAIREKLLFYKAYSYSTKAAYFLEIGGKDSIPVNLERALKIFEKINALEQISGVYALFAVYHSNAGNVLKSLDYTRKSLKISEQIDDYAGMSYAYSILGNHSFDLKDYEATLEYLTKAYKYAILNNDIRFAGINLVDISKLHLTILQLDSSLYYADKGEELAKSINDSYGILNAKKVKAKIFLEQKDYENAYRILKEVETISRKKKSKALLSLTLKDLARVALESNNILEAEKYAKESYDLSKDLKRIENKMKSTKILFQVYEKQNKNDLAIKILKEYYALNDSVFNKKNKKSILEQEVKITYEKQKEIDNIQHEKEIAVSEAQKQRTRIGMISAAIIAGLIGLFSLLIFNKLKLIRKQKTELDNAYEQLEESKKNELAVSNLKALQSQMNPHFIFNALNSVQDLVLLKDIRNSNKYLGKFSDLIRKILLSSKEQFITLEEEVEMLTLYLDLEKLRFGEEFEVDILCNVSEQKQDEIELPAMFIQPYIENAIKHGLFHKQGLKKLKVHFNLKENYLECIVEDNGIGQKKAEEFKIKRLHLHTGFSTEAINERIRLLNETLDKKIALQIEDLFDGENAIGTKITLLFPI